MEYYIYITYKCNLNCSYCSAKNVTRPGRQRSLSTESMERIIEYIKSNGNGQKDTVVFYGGEPLLKRKIIRQFINKTRDLNLDYILYTNGILLNQVTLEFLNHFDTIFISVDGDKISHEKHRGKGTYDRILENMRMIKGRIDPHTIGRITVEEETDLYDSVTGIAGLVDSVYWQIVNKPFFRQPGIFLSKYQVAINRILNEWIENLKTGKKVNYVPIISIVSHLLFNYNNEGYSFRCGSGRNFQAIDIDGNVYWCDEYVGNPDGRIGTINKSIPRTTIPNHEDIFSDCIDCDISGICLGRCRKSLTEYNDQTKRLYCRSTKILVNEIKEEIKNIKSCIETNNYDLETFYDTPRCTEEIP